MHESRLGQWVARRHHRHEIIVEQERVLQRPSVDVIVNDRHIDSNVAHRLVGDRGGFGDDVNGDVGPLLGEVGDDARQPVIARVALRRDSDRPRGRRMVASAERRLHLIEIGEHPLRNREEEAPASVGTMRRSSRRKKCGPKSRDRGAGG